MAIFRRCLRLLRAGPPPFSEPSFVASIMSKNWGITPFRINRVTEGASSPDAHQVYVQSDASVFVLELFSPYGPVDGRRLDTIHRIAKQLSKATRCPQFLPTVCGSTVAQLDLDGAPPIPGSPTNATDSRPLAHLYEVLPGIPLHQAFAPNDMRPGTLCGGLPTAALWHSVGSLVGRAASVLDGVTKADDTAATWPPSDMALDMATSSLPSMPTSVSADTAALAASLQPWCQDASLREFEPVIVHGACDSRRMLMHAITSQEVFGIGGGGSCGGLIMAGLGHPAFDIGTALASCAMLCEDSSASVLAAMIEVYSGYGQTVGSANAISPVVSLKMARLIVASGSFGDPRAALRILNSFGVDQFSELCRCALRSARRVAKIETLAVSDSSHSVLSARGPQRTTTIAGVPTVEGAASLSPLVFASSRAALISGNKGKTSLERQRCRGIGCLSSDETGFWSLDVSGAPGLIGLAHPSISRSLMECVAGGGIASNAFSTCYFTQRLTSSIHASLPPLFPSLTLVDSPQAAQQAALSACLRHARQPDGKVLVLSHVNTTDFPHPLSNILTLPPPCSTFGPYSSLSELEASERYCALLKRAMSGELFGCVPAVLLLRPVDILFGGVSSISRPLLTEIARIARTASCAVIFDETESGFGFFGGSMWAFDDVNKELYRSADPSAPQLLDCDVLVFGMEVSGFSLGGVAAVDSIAAYVRLGAGLQCFGPSGVIQSPSAASASVCLGAWSIIEEENRIRGASFLAAYLANSVAALRSAHLPRVDSVRCCGLAFGVDLLDHQGDSTKLVNIGSISDASPRAGAPPINTADMATVVQSLRNAGVICRVGGPHGSTLVCQLSLCVTPADVDFLVRESHLVVSFFVAYLRLVHIAVGYFRPCAEDCLVE